MGHWATYRRRGGGPPIVSGLIEMTLVILLAEDQLGINFTDNITAATFDPAFFEAFPSLFQGVAVNQGAPNSLVVDMAGTVDSDTSLTYFGSVPGILTPQTLPITP